jgi:hypothetical protein
MASNEWPTSEQVNALIEQLDRTVRDAEVVRMHVERQLRSRSFYPDRRNPRRWEHADRTKEE